ncbi:hypothetical protein G6F46_013849 [Rhizopus delemar]|nr:hypothetical protein G6F46_013849 [Rhizopus delemar]
MWRGWRCAGRLRPPAWRQWWADAGRHRRRGQGGDPVHQRLHRRAQGRGLPSPPLRRPDPAAGQRVRHGSRWGGPADLPALRAVRSGAGPDLGDPGHGPDAAGTGRSGAIARRHPALRRDPAVRFTGPHARAGQAWPPAADRDPGDVGRCAGAAGRGCHHPPPVAGRCAGLDPVGRHRVPAGGRG